MQKTLPGHLNIAGVRMKKLNYFYPCFRWSQCHNVLSQCSQCQVLSWLFQRAEQKKKKWKHLFLPTKSVSCLWNGCPWSQGQHTRADWEGRALLWKENTGKIWAKRLIVPSDTVPKHPKGKCTQKAVLNILYAVPNTKLLQTTHYYWIDCSMNTSVLKKMFWSIPALSEHRRVPYL